jgi:biopolymer transport protein ExbB
MIMELARNKTATFIRTLLGAAMLLAFCTSAFAGGSWWDKAWTSRKKITVDATAAGGNIAEPVGGATVLLRLYDANFTFASAKEDLGDLRFVSEDDKTVLPHHVEKLDSLMGEALVWVKLPDLKPGAKNSFWMYFGSGDPKAVKSEDSRTCYDADTMLVFHFTETGAPAADATKNSNVAENPGTRAEGAIGSGVSFNGKNPVNVVASSALVWSANAPLTLTAWVKPTAPKPDAVILSRTEGASSLAIGVNAGVPYVEINGQRGAGKDALAPGQWAHFALVCEGAKSTLYVNGDIAAAVGAGLPALNSNLILGGGFTGDFDELQVHKVARPIGFIQLAAFSQSGDKVAKTLSFGELAQPKDWLSWLKSGTFGVIIGNLTFDGWLVIVILAVMAVLSWYVMVNKVRYLNGIASGNELFMKQWREIVSDLTVLDAGDPEQTRTLGGRLKSTSAKKLRHSSVYRIYHIGVEEVRHRIEEDRKRGVERGLSGRSIQSVRASLDGGLVRETQKINKQIVLLTICISGGPFLGLLGTVVGVMITFAAVAAAGEVNVNAIAPGIAAALLATVAGLAVAIPSLFGYNYILSRVKDAKDDMHIFIDEFVTRMAEFYKEKGN